MVELRIGDETLELSWDEWEARVRAGRVPPSALVRFEPATGDAWVRAEELELYESLRDDAAVDLRTRFSSAPPLLTALLVGLQIKLWWMAWWLPEVDRFMIRDLTLFLPAILEDGQSWRMLTMGLSHSAAFHLFMNILWFSYCGWNLERVLGRLNLAVLFFSSVMFGSLLSMFGEPGSPSLGSSGGVYGLVAASIVFGFVRPQMLPERGRRLFGWALVPYLVVMFASGLMSETTDNWSHFGGLLAGGTLAIFLDPPSVQRRPHWNRLWYALTGGGSVFLLLLFAAVGPRLHPLTHASLFVVAATDEPPEASLVWSRPVGWRSGMSSAGSSGWESPAGHRSWSVIERHQDRPIPAEELRTTWLVGLEKTFPDLQATELDDVALAGESARGARVLLPGAAGGDRILEYRVAVRGTWSLESTWEVEADREHRLAPLQRRVEGSVQWNLPSTFESARIDVEHSPDSGKSRDRWATALADVGRVEEALEVRRALLAEFPTAIAYWSGMLDLIGAYPDAVPDREALWQAALEAHPTGSMAAAVAGSMERAGQPDAAKGLLDLAWNTLPGERSVRRARRREGLSVAFAPTGDPWGLMNDPVTGQPRDPEAIEAIRSLPWTLEAARTRGAALAAERDAVVQAAVDALEAGELGPAIDRTAWIKLGSSDVDPEDRGRIHEDLHRAGTTEHPPRWLPQPLVAAARANPPAPPAQPED